MPLSNHQTLWKTCLAHCGPPTAGARASSKQIRKRKVWGRLQNHFRKPFASRLALPQHQQRLEQLRRAQFLREVHSPEQSRRPWSHVPQAARQLPWPAFDNYGNLQNEALGPGRSCRILRYNLHLTGPSPLSKNAKHSQSPQLLQLQISKAQMEQNSTNGYKRDVPTSDSTKWLITTQVGMIRPIPEPRLRSYFSLRRSLNIFCRLLLRYHRDGNTCISMHVNPKKQSLQNWGGSTHTLKKIKHYRMLMNDFEIEKAFSDVSWHCNGKYDEPRHWRHGCRLPLDCYRIRFIICSLTIGFLVRLPQSWTHRMKPQQNLRLTPPSKKKTEPLKFTFCSLKPQPLQNDIHNYPMILSQSKTHMLLEY